MYRTCGQYSVFCMWVLVSNTVIGLYALEMWSVLFVMYVSDMFKYSDFNERTGQCCVFRIWVVGSKIAIGLYILDMWSVLFV